jgi:DNA polymerase-1
MRDAKLCLIDGNSLFYRAFYAIKAPLTTSSGQPTNAVFGFVKMIRKILDDLAPEYLAVCFDVGRVTHRTEKFAAYKMHRQPMPDGLISQVPLIKDVVRAYDFALFEKEGFEADDVIATVVHRMTGQFKKIVVISSDKDILQLVGVHVEVYNPYKEEGIVFGPDLVKERMGVTPERIKDLISLMGDASDNIPGAPGIGEKTARALLEEFESLDGLLKNLSRIKRESVRRIIEQNLDTIALSRDLATLRIDVPLVFDVEALRVKDADPEKLWDIFSRLEFKGMLKELCAQRLSCPAPLGATVLRKSVADESALLKEIEAKKYFSFYIEKDEDEPERCRVNIAWDTEATTEVDNPKFLSALFGLPHVEAVGYDIKRCLHVLRRWGVKDPRVAFFDVKLAGYCADSSRGAFELESLLWNRLKLTGISRQEYFGKESHFLLKLKEVLEQVLKENGLWRLYKDIEMPLAGILFEMEASGIAVDVPALLRLSRALDQRLRKLVGLIYDAAGCEFNINSPKQCGEVLFQKLKLPAGRKTKTGFSTDEEVLTKLSRDYDLPKSLLEYRQLAKLKTTYVDVLPGLVNTGTHRLHTTFHQEGTETGRLSSSNPNLQNIPIKTEVGAKIRGAFVAGEGFDELIAADYSQVELRVLAHLSGDAAVIAAFRKDADIHRATAALIFGVPESDATPAMRENAKRVNFGIVYGMSAYGLAKDLNIDPKTAETFIEEYFLRYPQVKEYLDSQIAFVKKHGYVTTLLGRRRYIPEIKSANAAVRQFAERQAINAPIQGSAADLIKMAMIALERRFKEKKFESRMVLQVHDELIFEVKIKEKSALAAAVKDGMENCFQLCVPLKVKVQAGKSWLEMNEVGS